MPYKKIERICEICGTKFLGIPTKKCCSRKCSNKLIAIARTGNPLTKICEYCKKEMIITTEREKREQKYCSKECADNAVIGVSLLDRGFSQKEYDKHINRTIDRNKNNTGKTYESIYGKEQAEKMILEKIKQMTGKKNNMSYESVMERFNLDTLEEACEMMPATGRFSELHPFFGKHHSVKSKIQMIETMEKNGSSIGWNRISNGKFDGIYFQGTWELKYIIDCIENNISIKRFDLEPIYYEFEDKPHHYFPDFIINENEIIEIKGLDKNNIKTIYKMKVAKKLHDNYKILYDVDQKQNPKTFLRLMKNKYKERLEIKYNPYEEKISV